MALDGQAYFRPIFHPSISGRLDQLDPRMEKCRIESAAKYLGFAIGPGATFEDSRLEASNKH
eukprot:5897369-Pyramimonas_sp.AAC.1